VIKATGVPEAPTNLQITQIAANYVSLSWADNSNNEKQFMIERSTKMDFSGPSTCGWGTLQNEESFEDLWTLDSNTRYYFRVTAFNDDGSSVPTNTVVAYIPASQAPRNLAVTALGITSVTLKWTDYCRNETNFVVQRATDKLFIQNVENFTTTSPKLGQFASFTDNTNSPNTRYYYRTAASFGNGTITAWSNFARAITLSSGITL
jgi:hypothetical protein